MLNFNVCGEFVRVRNKSRGKSSKKKEIVKLYQKHIFNFVKLEKYIRSGSFSDKKKVEKDQNRIGLLIVATGVVRVTHHARHFLA